MGPSAAGHHAAARTSVPGRVLQAWKVSRLGKQQYPSAGPDGDSAWDRERAALRTTPILTGVLGAPQTNPSQQGAREAREVLEDGSAHGLL